MTTILKLVGLVLIALLGGAFILFFGMWFVAAFAAMVALFLVAWLFGVPITIKENGVKTGYIRWTKFYPTGK